MSIDPRLAERRREVAEDRARRSVGRLLRFMALLAIAGGAVWLLFSPFLRVNEVRTAGIGVSSAHRLLVEHGVRAGTPMILLRPTELEAILEEDPWVGEARVHLDWPTTVIVRVVERVPVAWVETRDGWTRRDIEGVAVPSSEKPGSQHAWVRLPQIGEFEAESSPEVLGSVEFVAALPVELQADTIVWREGNGELWATVLGYRVRLGRPVEMTAKALSLVALLGESPHPSSILTLVAPGHPAVTPAVPMPRETTNLEPVVEPGDGEQP